MARDLLVAKRDLWPKETDLPMVVVAEGVEPFAADDYRKAL